MKQGLPLPLLLLSACAIHPEGEDAERDRAAAYGSAYARSLDERELPVLGAGATAADYVRHALLANGELEQRYYEWVAALERIPQEASPPGTLALSFSHMLDGGASAWDRTTLALQTDPMENLPLPSKLETAGRRALEEARAAGLRFDEMRYELQRRVLVACAELALLDEVAGIAEENAALIELLAAVAEPRARGGLAPQQDLVKLQRELDLARNELRNLRAGAPGLQAELNALLGREPQAPVTAVWPLQRALEGTDEQLLARIAQRNPRLLGLDHELAGGEQGLELARQEYLPDFALSAGIVGSVSQFVGGMLTLPFLRREAIEGGIAQARAELAAIAALRRQAGLDLAARAVLELYLLRNLDRQLELYAGSLLPRTEQLVDLSRAAYTAGQVPLVELLESQRMLLEVRRVAAQLRAERVKALAELEALSASDLSQPADP